MQIIQQFISEELITAFGWTVIHSIWQAALIALIVGVLMLFLQKRSARLRYGIAYGALLTVFFMAMATFNYYYGMGVGPTMLGDAATGLMLTGEIEETAIQSFFYSITTYFAQQLPLIVTIWLLGVLFFTLRILGSLAYLHRLRHHEVYALPDVWNERAARILKKLKLQKKVKIAESALIKTPVVIGFFKPLVLLPIGTINALSYAETEAILAHEFAHVFRNDYILNLIQSVIEILFYYHPAVWWLSEVVRSERENCCDDMAVKLCGNSLDYAKALVNLQEISTASPILAMSFSGKKRTMLYRIQRILNQPTKRSHIMEKIMATAVLLIGFVLLSTQAKNTMTEESDAYSITVHTDAPDIEEGKAYIRILTDTVIPESDKKKKVTRTTVIKEEDGHSVELHSENGEITELKINGETISEEEYEVHEDLIEEVLENVPPPPVPPVAPEAERAPFSPVPPQAPVVPRRIQKIKMHKSTKVSKETDEDGNTVIVIEGQDIDEPMQIIVDDEDGAIIIDGEKVHDGETAIIIDETGLPNIHGIDFHNHTLVFPDMEFDFDYDLEDIDDLKKDLEKLQYIDTEQAQAWAKELKERTKKMENLYILEAQERAKDAQKRAKELQGKYKNQAHSYARVYRDRDAHGNELFSWHGNHNKNRNADHLHKKIERTLQRDGFIDDDQEYTFELSENKLKINGKKTITRSI